MVLLVGDCVLISECSFFECSYRGGNVERRGLLLYAWNKF